jgi:hypothetical protein
MLPIQPRRSRESAMSPKTPAGVARRFAKLMMRRKNLSMRLKMMSTYLASKKPEKTLVRRTAI